MPDISLQSGDIPVVLITGATGNLGREIARQFSAAGYRIALNYGHDAEKAAAVARLCNIDGGQSLLLQGDVTVDDDCRRLVDQIERSWGRVDVLVNNAATTRFIPHADLDRLERDEFRRVLDVNTIGAFQMSRAAAPSLARAGRGSIVNMSSASGLNGLGSSIAYAASKSALNTVTLAMSRVLAPDVRVNAICPAFIEGGWMKAAMGDDAYEQFRSDAISRTPLKRAASPEDVSRAVLWLARDASHLTGELLRMDGGLHLMSGR
ncbi:hypothetical protein A6U85_25330 [Agrobacterium sp. 13-626]|nr:hypothetical protein A6U85_25330 [Agrobacterium sp. 13-626]